MSDSKNPILLDNERRTLDSTLAYRQRMIDDLFEDGVPDKKLFRLTNEILTGIDNAMLKRIELRQKEEQHRDEQELIREAVELAKSRISKKIGEYKKSETDAEIEIPDKYIPTDIVPGENKLEPEPLNVDDFIEEK